jgi:hypothetical protein
MPDGMRCRYRSFPNVVECSAGALFLFLLLLFLALLLALGVAPAPSAHMGYRVRGIGYRV